MKICIKAMSMNRGNLRAWIDDHTRQTIIALAQLYLFPHGNRVHWRKEVWEKFHEMHRLKPSNKLPSSKFILDNSFNLYQPTLMRLIQYALDKEENYIPIRNIQESEFMLMVEDYFLWLANYLSQTDTLNKQDVLDKLDEIGLTEEYNRE